MKTEFVKSKRLVLAGLTVNFTCSTRGQISQLPATSSCIGCCGVSLGGRDHTRMQMGVCVLYRYIFLPSAYSQVDQPTRRKLCDLLPSDS